MIKFNQKDLLKRYTDVNTELRQLMSEIEKTIENVRKYWDFKLLTTEIRRNYLVSEPNYHTTNFFTENLFAIEMKKLKY